MKTPEMFLECYDAARKKANKAGKTKLAAMVISLDHFRFLGNCPPTPPLSQH